MITVLVLWLSFLKRKIKIVLMIGFEIASFYPNLTPVGGASPKGQTFQLHQAQY